MGDCCEEDIDLDDQYSHYLKLKRTMQENIEYAQV